MIRRIIWLTVLLLACLHTAIRHRYRQWRNRHQYQPNHRTWSRRYVPEDVHEWLPVGPYGWGRLLEWSPLPMTLRRGIAPTAYAQLQEV